MDAPAVVPYDPRWPDLFELLRGRADAALADLPHVTEHVGSTAVPGLLAKPIIDLDVVVPDEHAVRPAIAALSAAGWRHEGDLGITGREAFLPPADVVYHHLYLVVAGSQAHRDHIDLRDFLRAHPGQAARYGELKRRLAVLLPTDRQSYASGKAEMITDMLREARRPPRLPVQPAVSPSPAWLLIPLRTWRTSVTADTSSRNPAVLGACRGTQDHIIVGCSTPYRGYDDTQSGRSDRCDT
jgi:GrpB-like predicted nucleotidyltransferase (UPF0157 family)